MVRLTTTARSLSFHRILEQALACCGNAIPNETVVIAIQTAALKDLNVMLLFQSLAGVDERLKYRKDVNTGST